MSPILVFQPHSSLEVFLSLLLCLSTSLYLCCLPVMSGCLCESVTEPELLRASRVDGRYRVCVGVCVCACSRQTAKAWCVQQVKDFECFPLCPFLCAHCPSICRESFFCCCVCVGVCICVCVCTHRCSMWLNNGKWTWQLPRYTNSHSSDRPPPQ